MERNTYLRKIRFLESELQEAEGQLDIKVKRARRLERPCVSHLACLQVKECDEWREAAEELSREVTREQSCKEQLSEEMLELKQDRDLLVIREEAQSEMVQDLLRMLRAVAPPPPVTRRRSRIPWWPTKTRSCVG